MLEIFYLSINLQKKNKNFDKFEELFVSMDIFRDIYVDF